MTKNTAGQFIGGQLVNTSDGQAFTGSATCYVTGDAGTQAIGSVGSGACAHEGNGYHTYAPSQAETNHDLIAFTFIGTGAVPATVQVQTTANLITAIATAVWAAGTRTLTSFGSLVADVATDVWSATTRVLTAGTNIVLAKGVGVTGFNDLSSAQVNTEVDTALSDIGLTTTVTGRIDVATSTRASQSSLDTAAGEITTLLGKFTGITLLAQWLGLIAGKQTGNSTARTELRATGAGSGTYDETTDSQEAMRDNMGTAQTGDAYARLGAPAGASVSADIAAVKSVADAVKAKTDNLPADPADQSAVELAITAATGPLATSAAVAALDAKVDDILEDTGTTLPATLAAISAFLDTEIALILADTNELQTDWVNGGRLDLLIDAIKAKTDQFVFTTAGQVDARAMTVSDKTGYSIGTGGISAASFAASAIDAGALATDAVTEIVTAVFARAFSAGYNSLTFDQIVKVVVAAVAGKSNGLETTEATYRNLADTQDVIVATVTPDGNRTDVTLNP